METILRVHQQRGTVSTEKTETLANAGLEENTETDSARSAVWVDAARPRAEGTLSFEYPR
jgi:hypothetical protein